MGNSLPCIEVESEIETRLHRMMMEALATMKHEITECIKLELSQLSKTLPESRSVSDDPILQ